MTTHIRPQDNPNLDTDTPEARERAAPVLLGALAVALAALGVWGWAQHRGEPAGAAPAVTLVVPEPAAAPAVPAAKKSPHGTAATRTVVARPVQARPAPADRAARPLAGNPLPDYPRTALRDGHEGSVTLDIAVDARGVPTDVRVVQRSGDRDRDFDRAAIEAARAWRFDPAIRNGRAVASSVRLPVAFQRG